MKKIASLGAPKQDASFIKEREATGRLRFMLSCSDCSVSQVGKVLGAGSDPGSWIQWASSVISNRGNIRFGFVNPLGLP